jgi:hypothetical protein
MQKGGHKECDDLEPVVLRAHAFKAATSKVEQSFSKIDSMLCKNRLGATAPVENMYVNLLMAAGINGAELASVIDGAINVWNICFPSTTRVHTLDRKDKGVPRLAFRHAHHAVSSLSSKPTEKTFLLGIKRAVASSSTQGASDALLAVDVPLWEKSHEDELVFQKQKRRKREVEACLQDHLLTDEIDASLQSASAVERVRQCKSYVTRLQDRLKYKMKTEAVPPTPAELFRSKVYLDVGTKLPREWLATLVRVEATVTNDLHVATVFVADNPRSPTSPIITLVASLTGSWVISPSVFVGGGGPSVKYLEAITSKRVVWASAAFQQTSSREWLAILEVANNNRNGNCKWTFLGSCQEWATARVIAERKKKPTDVIALVGPLELRDTLKHCFSPAGLVAFIARSDPNKGSIGLLNM